MTHIFNKKAALLALLFFTFFSAPGQMSPINSVHPVDSNGVFWGTAGGGFSIEPSNDSLLYSLHLEFPDFDHYTTILLVMRKSDLSIKDKFFIDTVSATGGNSREQVPI